MLSMSSSLTISIKFLLHNASLILPQVMYMGLAMYSPAIALEAGIILLN